MKIPLLSSLLVLSLSGCLLPSGINPTLGCSPLTGCQSKDYYLPGKGVWAPQQSFNKSMIGAAGGAAAGAALGSKSGPLVAAAYSVVGLILGHEIGATFDKVDQMYATMTLRSALNNNQDGQLSTWQSPDQKSVYGSAGPVATNGNCREFVSNIQVGNETRKMKGTACMINSEWVLRELYE